MRAWLQDREDPEVKQRRNRSENEEGVQLGPLGRVCTSPWASWACTSLPRILCPQGPCSLSLTPHRLWLRLFLLSCICLAPPPPREPPLCPPQPRSHPLTLGSWPLLLRVLKARFSSQPLTRWLRSPCLLGAESQSKGPQMKSRTLRRQPRAPTNGSPPPCFTFLSLSLSFFLATPAACRSSWVRD